MAEERRISHLFLDEVTYFMERARLWDTPPIFYPFLTETLACEAGVRRVAEHLLDVLAEPRPEAAASAESQPSGKISAAALSGSLTCRAAPCGAEGAAAVSGGGADGDDLMWSARQLRASASLKVRHCQNARGHAATRFLQWPRH